MTSGLGELRRNLTAALQSIAGAVDELDRMIPVLDALRTNGEVSPVLLTPEQAAAALGVSRSQVFALLKTGQLRSLKLGTSRRIPTRAIVEFVAELEDRQWSP